MNRSKIILSTPMFYSNNLPADVKAIITPYTNLERNINEPDFYGASDMIAERLLKRRTPVSLSTWSHGCNHARLKFVQQIIWTNDSALNRLVSNGYVAKFLLDNGVKRVTPVGAPIIYTNNLLIKRKRNSVLFMPAHSLPYVQFDQGIEEMIISADKLRSEGVHVCFCVHIDCVKSGKITSLLDNNRLDWFAGASVYDKFSLQRMRNIFSFFEKIESNVMGSHFYYSQLFGAEFYFSNSYLNYRKSWFKNDPHWKGKEDILSYALSESSRRVIECRFPGYFIGYENAICDQALAADACGVLHQVSDMELADLLGWSLRGKLIGYTRRYGVSAKNKVFKLIG